MMVIAAPPSHYLANEDRGTKMNRTKYSWTRRAALAIALLTTVASAQTATPTDGASTKPFVGLAHTAIRVKDIAAASAFYEKLGFERAFSAEKNGVVTQAFYKINDRQFLELYPRSGSGADADKQPIGFLHLCFDGVDLAALRTHYLNEGLTPTDLKTAGMGNLLFTLKGPEDQLIEYTQYMPTSKHTLDRGQHLGPDRISTEEFGVALPMQDLPAAMSFYKFKLGFPTLAGHPDILIIPGSMQQIHLFSSSTPDLRSRTYFAVASVSKATAELKKRGIPTKPGKGSVTVTDPDGNLLIFRADKVAQKPLKSSLFQRP
jgi:catechol 2,3-dioxygenase-like lactoylglutathione lyase family enzyme